MANYVEISSYIKQDDDFIYQSDLNQSLRQLLGDDGWILPRLTTANVVSLGANILNGTIWYNIDTNEFECMKASTVRQILTT